MNSIYFFKILSLIKIHILKLRRYRIRNNKLISILIKKEGIVLFNRKLVEILKKGVHFNP